VTFRIVAAGDSALLAQFDERVDPVINAHVVAVAAALRAARVPGVRDVVPTYRSVGVHFDPLKTDYDALVARIERLAATVKGEPLAARQPIRVPVCYGGDFGPDLPLVARFAQLSEREVIDLHAGTTYRVFMLGFSPGFPYMGVVDARIAAPRRETPRVLVPGGSVGLAGEQTGVYPSDSPGGWQIIGRTPVARDDRPFLLEAGDLVRFDPITRDEFDRWPSA
jgi:KipI family sensor histidine kinase inhibitor